MDRLRHFLTASGALLVICGYSFRDEHLNDVITEGLQGNPAAVAFGLVHGPLAQAHVAQDLAQVRPNLTIVAFDHGVVGTRTEAWGTHTESAPDYVTVTDQPDATGRLSVCTSHIGDFSIFSSLLRRMVGSSQRGDTHEE